MADDKKDVVLDGGKYRFHVNERGVLHCDCNGNPWRDFLGDKAVRALFDETIARQPAPAAAAALRSHWDEDPQFPVVDWKYEVENNDTRLGYHEWVDNKREASARDEPQAGEPTL